MGSKRGLGIVAVLALMTQLATARAQPLPATSPSDLSAAVIPVAGEVDDFNRDDLFRRFETAKKLGAKVIVLKINTYGGLVTSGLDISRFLRGQEGVHTIAYIDDKAISAGALIAMACDEIVMKPGSTLGDCAPIVFNTIGQLEPMPAAERAKAQSPILQDFEDSARRNGYNPLVADAMVAVEKTVYLVENSSGERKAVDEKDYAALVAGGEWKPAAGVKNPVDGPDTLLTVGPELAADLGLSRGQATTAGDLARQRGYNIIADLTPSLGDKLVAVLGSPAVRFLLLTIFLQSLYIVLHAPGHGAAEAVAVVSIGLLVGIPLLTGYAQWWEVAVIFGGLALVAFEIFVFPGHMVSAVVGTMMVVFGLVMTFVGDAWRVPHSWRMPETWHSLQSGLYVVVGGMFCSLLLSAWLRRYLPKTPYFNRLILTAVSGGPAVMMPPPALSSDDAPAQDAWPFVGTIGHAVSDLKPGGQASFPFADDTRVTAVVSDSGYVRSGTKLAVREVRGSRIVVRAVGAS